MNVEVGTPVRLDGAVRSPDREGAIAHLDLDRGFAMVARAALSGVDVVDPAIWVREKLSLALAGAIDEPPLRAILGALRSLHGEIMKRPERDRSWISAGVLLFHGDDGVAITAGDAPCFRYRDGVLASLGRPSDESAGGAPRGSLGSETQVRIEVVPLRPQPGDLYLLATRPLREGELAILSRALEGARTPGELLRVSLEGGIDTGRLVLRVLSPHDSRTGPESAPATTEAEPESMMTVDPLEIEPLIPADVAPEPPASPEAPESSLAAEDPEDPVVAAPADALAASDTPWSDDPADRSEDTEASKEPEPATLPPPARHRPALATVGEERPWYEPLALWGGGALAIIALALLVRAILPGIMGSRDDRGSAVNVPPRASTATSGLEIISEPPGAMVRLNGEPLPGRTPLSGIAVDPGIHRVELDWGPGGTWSDTVEVAAGARLTLHPAIFGSISFRASEPSRVLDVYVDGAYSGTTPLTLDRITVGRHLIRFGGPGLALTAQEVDVLRDVHVELAGNAGPDPAPGKVTVASAILGDEGFQTGKGDPIWVDGVARGATPFTASLAPGMHSVRVVRRDFPAQVTVLDVKPGNEHFVTAEFGARSGEPLRFTPPDVLSRSQPTPLSISLPGDAADVEHSVWLYAAAPGGSFQPRAMARLAGEARRFAALVPEEVLKNQAGQIRVYFKATAAGGHEIFSEIQTIPVRD
ncbi:MAG: PEGA domain-containing protein [Candidatus Eisenbacteria bacterium]